MDIKNINRNNISGTFSELEMLGIIFNKDRYKEIGYNSVREFIEENGMSEESFKTFVVDYLLSFDGIGKYMGEIMLNLITKYRDDRGNLFDHHEIRKIIVHTVIIYHNQKLRIFDMEMEELIDNVNYDPIDDYINSHMVELVFQSLSDNFSDRFPNEYSAVIDKIYHGMTYKEIALKENRSYSLIPKRYEKGMRILRHPLHSKPLLKLARDMEIIN